MKSSATEKKYPNVCSDEHENSLAEKFLGVLVDEKLSMSQHRAVQECSQQVGGNAWSSLLPGARETMGPWK